MSRSQNPHGYPVWSKERVREALARTDTYREAARQLGATTRTLRRWRKKHDIEHTND